MVVEPGPLGGDDQGVGDAGAGNGVVELHGPGGGPDQAAVATTYPRALHGPAQRASGGARQHPVTSR